MWAWKVKVSKMIVAYITDLFSQADISQTASEAGVEIKVISSLYKLLPEIEAKPSAVLVDLNAQGISPTALIVQVKQRNPQLPVIAYGQNTTIAVLHGARKAGADHILEESEDSLSEVLKKFS